MVGRDGWKSTKTKETAAGRRTSPSPNPFRHGDFSSRSRSMSKSPQPSAAVRLRVRGGGVDYTTRQIGGPARSGDVHQPRPTQHGPARAGEPERPPTGMHFGGPMSGRGRKPMSITRGDDGLGCPLWPGSPCGSTEASRDEIHGRRCKYRAAEPAQVASSIPLMATRTRGQCWTGSEVSADVQDVPNGDRL